MYSTAITEHGLYKAAGNLLWVDMLWSAQPGVPINRRAITEIKDHYFKAPCPYPGVIVVGVNRTDMPTDSRGKLRRISPEEMPHALIIKAPASMLLLGWAAHVGCSLQGRRLSAWSAPVCMVSGCGSLRRSCREVAEEIKSAEVSGDDSSLRGWFNMLLSVSFHFKLLESDDAKYWEAVRLREHLVVDFSTMARDAVQRVFELAAFKAKQEARSGRLTALQVAELYGQNGDLAPSSEPITKNMVENAISVHGVLQGVSGVQQVLQAATAKYGKQSPFNSVLKLHLISNKAKDLARQSGLPAPVCVQWSFAAILDITNCGFIEASEVAIRNIKGEGNAGKGIVDILIFKYRMLRHLLDEWLNEVSLKPLVKAKLREVYQDHAHCRLFCGWPGDNLSEVDLTWQAGWPPSALQTARLIEDVVYGREYDVALKGAVRGSKMPAEAMDSQVIADMVSQIMDDMKAESVGVDGVSGDMPKNTPVLVDDSQPPDDLICVIGEVGLDRISDEHRASLRKFRDLADRTIRQQVKLVVEPTSQDAIAAEIMSGQIGRQLPDEAPKDNLVIFVYDSKVSGEAVTNPQTRKPPLRPHFKKCMAGALTSRKPVDQLDPHDVFVMFDAGKHGTTSAS
jgi:hypothetical protein